MAQASRRSKPPYHGEVAAGTISQVEAPPRAFPLRLYPALGVRAYRQLWLGMLPATLAWQMNIVVTGYAAFQLSGSATALGLTSSAQGLPMLLLALIGGVVADRLPRRTILMCTQSLLGLSNLMVSVLALSHLLQVWHLVIFGLLQGTAIAFNMPARQAYIGHLMEGRLLRNAVALNSAGMNACRLLGPAIAGGLLAVPGVGVAGAYCVMTAMYAAVVASLIGLPDDSRTRQPGESRPPGWTELLEGVRYVGSEKVVRALLGLAVVILFFGQPFQQIMPVFSERIFHVGPGGLGALMTCFGVGAITGAVSVASFSQSSRPALLQLIFGTTFGLCLAVFALAPSFAMALAALVLVGFNLAAYNALNNTMIMGNTEPRFYGRVMSIYQLTFAVSPFGALPLAWGVEHIGAPFSIAGAGLIVAATVILVAVLYPPYRHIT